MMSIVKQASAIVESQVFQTHFGITNFLPPTRHAAAARSAALFWLAEILVSEQHGLIRGN
jgi:hypothetical protein